MSFANKSAATAFAGLLLFSTSAFAQVGGGTELPNNAEPNGAKANSEKMDKGGMKKSDGSMMKKEGSMEKGGNMKSGDKM